MSLVVAIDGPAGAGKSTIAKKVARSLSAIYVDTGAMYRAMALFMLRNGLTDKDTDKFAVYCKDADISIKFADVILDNGTAAKEQQVILNGENVNGFIRTEEVGKMASVSSTDGEVRKKLVELQRKLADNMDVVMDGRDIGTHVLPNANVKIYLTASSAVRAKRRYDELCAKGEVADLDVIEKDIIERDERDMNREISPLKQAKDAILVDSSNMSIEEVEQTLLDIIRRNTNN